MEPWPARLAASLQQLRVEAQWTPGLHRALVSPGPEGTNSLLRIDAIVLALVFSISMEAIFRGLAHLSAFFLSNWRGFLLLLSLPDVLTHKLL